MFEKSRGSISNYGNCEKQKKNETILDKKINWPGKQLTVGILIGVCCTIITIALQCVAFFTPHWKEISPNTRSLYVDGVDALIRTEVLIYFDVVHRFTHHSYGLFQRCEYPISNSSKAFNEHNSMLSTNSKTKHKLCTKNFLPTYDDKQFNECHSLQYYRFCSNKGEKNFDINNDYLRATFDISSDSPLRTQSTSSCDCHYPLYIKTCHVLGILSLICLCLMLLLFAIFPCLPTRHHRLKIKCFAVLSSLLAMLFILSNLLTVSNYLDHEAIEYLTAIERHYRSSQIYKLSQDTKVAIHQFVSSIKIQTGYSAIIAWISFFLSIVDSVLLMITCKVVDHETDVERLFAGVAMDSPRSSVGYGNEKSSPLQVRLSSPVDLAESQRFLNTPISLPPPPPPPPTSPPPKPTSQLPSSIVVADTSQESNDYSCTSPLCSKYSSTQRSPVEVEV